MKYLKTFLQINELKSLDSYDPVALKSFSIFNNLIIEEIISKDDAESSYLKMRPRRFKEFNTKLTRKLIDVFREDIDKYDNFVDFKKAIILSKTGSETNLFAPKLAPKYNNLTFEDKDMEDWWGQINRSIEDVTQFLYNMFHEAKGRPERTKTYFDPKSSKADKYTCKINSINDLKIFGPYSDERTRGDSTFYKILLPKECLDIFKNIKNKIGEYGDKRNIEVEFEKTGNAIHFPKGIAEELRGNDLGHWIYLAMIKKMGYLSSKHNNSPLIKQVYLDLLSLPKFENEVMTLLMQYDVLIFDKNTKLDVKKIFREFIFDKYTDKKSVKCSPALKEILGSEFTNWYDTLFDKSSKETMETKIKKYEGETPQYGDIVWDVELERVFKCNGVWKDYKVNKEVIQLRFDFELKNLPYDSKRYKVIMKKNQF